MLLSYHILVNTNIYSAFLVSHATHIGGHLVDLTYSVGHLPQI